MTIIIDDGGDKYDDEELEGKGKRRRWLDGNCVEEKGWKEHYKKRNDRENKNTRTDWRRMK